MIINIYSACKPVSCIEWLLLSSCLFCVQIQFCNKMLKLIKLCFIFSSLYTVLIMVFSEGSFLHEQSVMAANCNNQLIILVMTE